METGVMTVHDLARYLRLSEAKVYKMAKAGFIPAIRIGKSWRFKRDVIDEWLRKEAQPSSRMAV
ncbi:MAG: helix-turn-helix domain-containing protein [Nanoarchaeota archaeon]|nr:helix-turn-helix domain-containing protein [Nanoarchaeota archaeon]